MAIFTKMLSVTRALHAAGSATLKKVAASAASIHTLQIVQLHDAMEPKKDESINMAGTRLHSTSATNTGVKSAVTAAPQVSAAEINQSLLNMQQETKEIKVSKRLDKNTKSLEGLVTGVNPFTGEKLTNSEKERLFGIL